jgi:hypothetical protein
MAPTVFLRSCMHSLEKLDVEEDRTALLESMQYIETLAQQERSNGIQK